MALNNMGLGVTFTARDAMTGTLVRLQRAFTGLAHTSRMATAAVSAGFAAMAAGVAIAFAGLMTLNAGLDLAAGSGAFEAKLARVGQIAGATSQELAMLRSVALDAATVRPFNPIDILQGLEDIAALGFSAAESAKMIRPALNLAAGGGISVSHASESMGAALKVFQLDVEDATMAADKLLKIANLTALQAKDLRLAIGTVGRGATATKQSLDEMLISMGLVKNTGVQTSVAASSVSSALIFMAKNADKFTKIGVKLTDASGKFRPFMDIVLETRQALSGITDEAERSAKVYELFSRFGSTAYQALATQLEKGVTDTAGNVYQLGDAVGFLRSQMADATGTAKQFVDAVLMTYEGARKLLDSNLSVFAEQVGEGFREVFRPAMAGAVRLLQSLNAALESIPLEGKRAIAGLVVLTGVFLTLAGVAMFATGALTAFVGLMLFAGPAVLMFFAGLLAIWVPLTALALGFTAALTALGAALYLIFTRNLGGATDKLLDTFSRWKLIFQSVIAFLTEGKLTGALAQEFAGADKATQDFVVRATLWFEKIKVFFAAAFGAAEKYLRPVGRIFDDMGMAVLTLMAAIGLTDSAYVRMVDTMTKDQAFSAGVEAGKLLAKQFMVVAVMIQLAFEWAAKLIDLLGGAGKFLLTLAFGGHAEDVSGVRPPGVPDQPRPDLKPPPLPRLPAVLAPQSSAEAEEQARMSTEAGNMQAMMAKVLAEAAAKQAAVEQKIQLVVDGDVLAEAVSKRQHENRVMSFAADAPWSE